MDRSTDSGRMRGDDRGFIDRAEDEVRSWFGDDDAERRRDRDRMMDRDDDRGDDRSRSDRGGFRGYDGPESERYRRNYEVGDEADRRSREGYSSGRFFYETADRNRSGNGPRDYGSRDRDSGSRGTGMSGSRRSSGMEYRGEDRDMGSGGYGSGGSGSEGYGSNMGSTMGSGMGRSSHAGRGPSGYSRSTDRVTEDVNEALMDDHDVDATNIQVSVDNGEVTLEGTVSSRDQKRRAEDVADHCRGVRDVHNRLRVSSDAGSGSMSSGSMSSGSGASGTMTAGGTGQQGSGAMVSGSSGGAMGAATQTSGASSMGSGGTGGMGTSPDMAGGTATPGAAMDEPAGSAESTGRT